MAKILIFDLETAPKMGYFWQFFKQNIGPKQVLEHGHIMCFSAKWLGSDEILYSENRNFDDDTELVDQMLELFSAADIVVAHNASRFDVPMVNTRALVHSSAPPAPYKIVDTLLAAKKHFKFDRNSLEYIAKVLGCDEKGGHKKFPGWELWLECLKENQEAWDEMREYNIQDVVTLEQVYLKMRPWISNHPNVGVVDEQDRPVCPKCGSHHIQLRGYATTNVGKYQRFQCTDCGGWARTRFTEYPKDKKKALITNAV